MRLEYVHQWGDNSASEPPGVSHQYDLDPPLDVATLHVGYTRRY